MKRVQICTLPVVLLVLPLVISGCCYVNELSSFKDPAFARSPYSALAVSAEIRNLSLRKDLENYISDAMTDAGIVAERGILLAPPTRDWTEETMREAYRSSGAEALLQIRVAGQRVREQNVPAETTTVVETKKDSEKTSGEIKRSDTEKSVVTTTTTGGYTERTVITDVELELIDLETDVRYWIATTSLPDANASRCMERFAENIVEDLQNNGILQILRR